MSESILQEQIAYYRARAGEYDQWFYRLGRYDRGEALNKQWFAEVEVVMRALLDLGHVADALELAAGTGNWTRELLKIADHIIALDASPEVLDINRQKLDGERLASAPNVHYQIADLFAWEPDRQSDLVFFGFWLSHVPPEQLAPFLDKVARSLRVGGKVFMVDSRPDDTSTATDHQPYEPHGIYHNRKLNDGSEYTIVKVFYEPDRLQAAFARAGLDVKASFTDHYFIYAHGTKRG
jgi:demethylmenaquinone methyltransferase/2-methoxy-6-polyprenyl-1,4-benzoquinol methylase